jgi:hypothetical protein
MSEVRTTNADRLDYLRLFRGSLDAHRARGDDLDDVIRSLDRAIATREKEEAKQ